MGQPGAPAMQSDGTGGGVEPTPPWQMWGNSAVTEITVASGTSVASASEQLASIKYKRPDNWRFFFGAKLLGGDIPTVVPVTFDIRFNLLFGVTRAVFNTTANAPVTTQTAFAHFVFSLGVGFAPATKGVRYTSRVRTPLLQELDPTSFEHIDLIPADTIQCSATIGASVGAPSPAMTFQVETTAYFSPNVHTRPEWNIEKFRGGEQSGK